MLKSRILAICIVAMVLGSALIGMLENEEVKAESDYSLEKVVPYDLQQLFKQYDTDNSNTIDWLEAKSFYYWVGDYIIYRYDNENEVNPQFGSPVGDGREGNEYWQTPYETYAERAGDCEDMAILELAFYTYWEILAEMGVVDVNGDGAVDHAICIVPIEEGVMEEMAEEQDISYYTIDGIKYIMVDNAYSDTFGTIDSKTEEDYLLGHFTLYETYTLQKIYDEKWNKSKETESFLYIGIAIIFVILVCLILVIFIIKNKLKPQAQQPYQPMQQQYQQPIQYPYQQQIILQQNYQSQQIPQQPYQSTTQLITCQNCQTSFQVSSQTRQVQCPNCRLKWEI